LLLRALRALGQPVDAHMADGTAQEVLAWGIRHWNASLIPRLRTIEEARID
ncbi:glutamyl-Q tRNA(Asp) ligase, partial [Pseudomonas syringae pv. actinidiae ICMP 18804]